jgi:rfaE bifunctional protein kinase chain/domain
MQSKTRNTIQLQKSDIELFRATTILVVGDVMLDRYWFGDTQRISPEAPVPIVQINRVDERLGGAANVARNAASLGAKVALLGLVGDDESGRQVGHLLNQDGIDSLLQIDSHDCEVTGSSKATAINPFRL